MTWEEGCLDALPYIELEGLDASLCQRNFFSRRWLYTSLNSVKATDKITARRVSRVLSVLNLAHVFGVGSSIFLATANLSPLKFAGRDYNETPFFPMPHAHNFSHELNNNLYYFCMTTQFRDLFDGWLL